MNEFKKLIILRGGQTSPKILQNGDSYDSTCEVVRKCGTIWHTGQYVNTDHTKNYKGGILEESENMAGLICQSEKRGKYIRIFYSKFIDKIKNPDDWYDYNTLASITPNPNHNNKKIVTNVLYHCGGYKSDGSQACITEYPDNYSTTMQEFEVGEFILISLGRRHGWTPPEFYKV